MSQEDMNLVRRIHAGWANGDMWAGNERYSEGVRFTSDWPDSSGGSRGIAELSRYMLEFLSQWESWRVFAEKFTELDEGVILVEGHTVGVGAGSGIATESPWFGVWVLESGKVAQLHVHHDRDAVLEAARLQE